MTEPTTPQPTGYAPRSPFRAALGALFWVGFLGGGIFSIIAWFAGTTWLIWLELGLGAVGFGITSGLLYLVVCGVTWRPIQSSVSSSQPSGGAGSGTALNR